MQALFRGIGQHIPYDSMVVIFGCNCDKDVDGMHPTNLGRLALSMPGPVPCTPAGIEALLAYYEIPVAGRDVCVLGRGATLGRPLALLLSQKRPTANAAVTVVHTGVPDWPDPTTDTSGQPVFDLRGRIAPDSPRMDAKSSICDYLLHPAPGQNGTVLCNGIGEAGCHHYG